MRTQVNEANVINLNPAAIGTPVTSNELYKGLFATKSLVWGMLLEVTITASVGAVTAASLGWLTIRSSREGDFPRIPLRMLYTVLPFLGVPCYTEAIVGPPAGNRYYIPVPYALIKGIRPKDTYMVSEKCNDFFIEIIGAPEGGVTYAAYDILPINIGESSRNVCIPSLGNIRYTTDDIPAGVDYKSKAFVKGASWVALMKSDYSDFAATDRFTMYVDGKAMQKVSRIHRESRVWAAVNQSRNATIGADTIPDNLIILPLSLDEKMAKISRNSQFIMEINSATSWTLQALYQPFEPFNESESLALVKRQNEDVTITPSVLPAPVGADGRINVLAKPIFRKLQLIDPTKDNIEDALRGRIANTR